jgi:outer membrane protein
MFMRLLRASVLGICLLGAATVAPATAQAQQAQIKVATVDFQKAVNAVKEGAAAQAKLKGLFDSKRGSIEQMEKKIQAMSDEYEKQALILSDSAKKAKEQEIMAAQATYQQTYMQSEQEMQAAYQGLMESLIGKMKVIAEQIGKEKGYTLVLEVSQGAVVYAGPGSTDITAELIKRYDAAYPG